MNVRRQCAAAVIGATLALAPVAAGAGIGMGSQERLTALIGSPVYSADGVRFGDVRALVMDRRTMNVLGAVVRYGGLLGVFASEILVPAEEIAAVNIDSVVLLWTAAEMELAPTIRNEEIAETPYLVQVE